MDKDTYRKYPIQRQSPQEDFLCPFAVYYLRYAVRLFFTLSRISAKERDKKYNVKSPEGFKK
jgi:hypothetical protein